MRQDQTRGSYVVTHSAMGWEMLVVPLGADCLFPIGGARGSGETSLHGQHSHCAATTLILSNSVCLGLYGAEKCFSLTPMF